MVLEESRDLVSANVWRRGATVMADSEPLTPFIWEFFGISRLSRTVFKLFAIFVAEKSRDLVSATILHHVTTVMADSEPPTPTLDWELCGISRLSRTVFNLFAILVLSPARFQNFAATGSSHL